jgi:hypothetical protein
MQALSRGAIFSPGNIVYNILRLQNPFFLHLLENEKPYHPNLILFLAKIFSTDNQEKFGDFI